eukprot:jgi/Ulvmu1/4612/UM002_0341.1
MNASMLLLCRGSQLWEKNKDTKWSHDGFEELIKNDTAPPRMVESRDLCSNGGRGRAPGRGGRAGQGKGRGRGGRDARASELHPDADVAPQAWPSRHPRQAPAPDVNPPGSAAPFDSRMEGTSTNSHSHSSHGPGRGTLVTPAELFAQAEDGRVTASSRQSQGGSSQYRPTFHGREVSAGQQDAHHANERAGAQSNVPSEAPAGSRRYLANRGDAAAGAAGPRTSAAVVMPVAPSMVAVHHADDNAHNVYFNPNAPGFLPMGGEGGEGAEGGEGGGPVVMMQPGVPVHTAPRPPGGSARADGQQQHTARYMSPATAKGVMLRHELQSMMTTPQGAMPVAPVAAPGYIPNHQVYYTSQPPAEAAQAAYGAQAGATFVAAPPMSNAPQHVTISPAAYGIPPGYAVAPGGQPMPQYASYVIDPNLVVGPAASGGMHMM